MIGTLDELKAKLELAADDASRDDALMLVLSAASEHVLELAGYLEADTTGRIDTFRNVQMDREFLLTKRPVDTDTDPVFEGRVPGQADWDTLTGDVLDAANGEVMLVGVQWGWPPISQPRIRRWAEYVYPIVRVTYTVTGIGTGDQAPDDVKDATLALARYWFEKHLAGAGTDIQVGPVAKTFSTKGVPAELAAALSRFERERARWV